MKKFISLFAGVLLLASCSNESVISENIITASVVAGKIGVCHNGGNEIVISENALQTHIDHGDAVDRDGDGFYDAENPCSATDIDDAIPFDQSTLVDADGDGFFTTENPFSDIDCDDADSTKTDNCITSVVIGTQTWMDKNLDVTTYRDGTPIPQVTDPTAWAALTTGAWCYYRHDSANGTTYGKLYNWYAVAGIHDNDASTPNKILAPTGWHVPIDGELTDLFNFLRSDGHFGIEGAALKSTSGWNSDGNGTDNYGFTGLPGGHRYYEQGGFYDVGVAGMWWSSTEHDTTHAKNFYLWYNHSWFDRAPFFKESGMSVRCLRD